MNDTHGLTVENLLRTLPDVLKNDESMAALAAAIAPGPLCAPVRNQKPDDISTDRGITRRPFGHSRL